MAVAKDQRHWGEWVLARSRAVGYRTQRQLAREVGCRHEQLSRWVQRATPPEQMRKGFDQALALALQIDRRMLFHDWKMAGPEEAPRVGPPPEGQLVPWRAEFPEDDMRRELIISRLRVINGDELKRIEEFVSDIYRGVFMRDMLGRQKFIHQLREKKVSDEEFNRALLEWEGRLPPRPAPAAAHNEAEILAKHGMRPPIDQPHQPPTAAASEAEMLAKYGIRPPAHQPHRRSSARLK